MARHNKKPLKTYPVQYKPGTGENSEPDISWKSLRDTDTEKRFQFKPANTKQEQLCQAIEKGQLNLVTGVAGTGKSLAVCAMAARLLLEGKIEKVIITRPMVGVGGKTGGFLPGDANMKMMPYVFQMLDYLSDCLGEKTYKDYLSKGIIEIMSLEFMRGFSSKKIMVICDESENLTWAELLMIVTRIGKESRMCLMGDLTQTDLNLTSRELPFYKFLCQMKPLIDKGKIGHFNLTEILRSGIVREIIDILSKRTK